MLLILLLIVNLCCGIDLRGSEHSHHHTFEKHKPLPYKFHPLHFKGTEQVNSHVHPRKETVTITKTIVIEATKRLFKQPVCVKAHPGVPYCHSKPKIEATPVLHTPVQKATKVIGFLEKSGGICEKSHQRREGPHIVKPDHFRHQDGIFFREFQTVTEILRITRIEHYVDSLMTATLVAENCIPMREDLPPCPCKFDDNDYPYKTGIEYISIIGKEDLERKIDVEDEDVTLFSDETTIFNSSLLFSK